MKTAVILSLSVVVATLLSATAFAQGGPIEMGDSGNEPTATPTPKKGSVVGRRAAEKYMAPNARPAAAAESSPGGLTSSDHYLAIHLGGYVSDNAYRWGAPDNQANVGKVTVGATYRVGEWIHSMDLALRLDYSSYGLAEGSAGKLSFMPIITLPDASSRFPLYLGVGVGLGIFTKQLNSKSALSLDYSLVLGARFFEVFNNTGFFIEAGLKNSLFLLSDGQFNGTFVAVGPVFTF